MKVLWVFFFLLLTTYSFSQVKELTGAIIIGRSEVLSYRVVYNTDEKGNVSGFTLSDLNGPSETKSRIEGTYDTKAKVLTFSEVAILSSKTGLSASDFCLMSVTGKFIKKDGKMIFRGTFRSKSENSTLICDSGTLVLLPTREMYELAAKAANMKKKIALPDSINRHIIEKLEPFEGVENVKELKAGGLAEYKLQADTVKLEILDDRLEDGDKISIHLNNKKIVPELVITNSVTTLKFAVEPGQNLAVFTITALNEGYSPPNTVKVIVSCGTQKELLIAQLKEKEYIRLIVKR